MSINKILKKISYISNLNLNEGVEYLTINGNTNYFRDTNLNTYAFIIINNKVLLSDKNKTHGDIIINHFNLKKNGYIDYDQFDKLYKSVYYSGRIWLDHRIISFWNSYVPDVIIYDIKNGIKNKFGGDIDINEFQIEYGKK